MSSFTTARIDFFFFVNSNRFFGLNNRNCSSSPVSLSFQSPPRNHKIKCSLTNNNNNKNNNLFWVLRSIRDFTNKWVSCLGRGRGRGRGRGDEVEEESLDFLQENGGIGVTLLSMTATAKIRISPFVATLAANPTFVSGTLAWVIAQSMKVFLNFFVERKWDFRVMFSSGGMPSSHSALCTALTTSVALCHGVADSLFPVCLGFSLIVMYDATGVRRHAGMQAQVLNMIIADLFQGHPISQRKLKELLGHTPSQVLAGVILGILAACFCCQGCVVGA